jgi:predicted NUDIX family NTP pyrophosphohydrolase
MYRADPLEVLLVHPGGPYWSGKDEGAWSIPKGEVEMGDEPLETARREFTEETGLPVGETGFIPLGEIQQKGGKRVLAWAFEGDCDPGQIRSNTFEIEWPPRSGRKATFPEIDRAAFFTPELARRKMNPAQAEFVARLEEKLTQS